nr:unnamed protein product [Spirometra erinaceieuropaei]
MVGVDGSSLRSVQKCRQDNGLVHLQFGIQIEAVADPHGVLQLVEGLVGLEDPIGHFVVDSGAGGSGLRDSSGRHGVAIALSQQADLALLAWEPVNDRMAYVRLKSHFTSISVSSVYAPTSAAEQRNKEAFYSQLQALVERLPRRDLLIVAGDWNGRNGPGDPTTSHLLGRFGLGSRCENGERLPNFADRNRLLITNTCFQHRKKHLLTCYSNDGPEKILEYTKRRRSDWISGRTLQLSAQTARARSRNDDFFRQLGKMTAKSARDDRKQHWAEIATSMEQASNVGDTRKFYQLIRQVSDKPSTLSDSVRDVNGGFVADNSVKVERWREQIKHHLNFDIQPTTPFSPLQRSPLCNLCSAMRSPSHPPSEGEVVDAIRKLRNNKALGEGGIPAEVFKSCVDTLAPWLHEVIERAWRDEVVPDDWGLGILVPILKKGDKTRCENYRGISFIVVAAKIFAIVLLRRFQAVRDSRTRSNHAVFRAGRGRAGEIFTLNRILEFHRLTK